VGLTMNHTPFIVAAFAVTALGMLWLIISSYVSMRRSEALAKDVSAQKNAGHGEQDSRAGSGTSGS